MPIATLTRRLPHHIHPLELNGQQALEPRLWNAPEAIFWSRCFGGQGQGLVARHNQARYKMFVIWLCILKRVTSCCESSHLSTLFICIVHANIYISLSFLYTISMYNICMVIVRVWCCKHEYVCVRMHYVHSSVY